MSGIGTKGKVKGGFVSKEIKPGNVTARINKIEIVKVDKPRDEKVPEYQIKLHLETKPLGEGFEGFPIDPQDLSKGLHKGQVKIIKHSTWNIKHLKGISQKTGKEYDIPAENQILQFLNELCTMAGDSKWIESVDGQFKTWKEFTNGMMRSGLFNKDKFFEWCLGATQDKNAAGYTVFHIYLPEKKVCEAPFAKEGGYVTPFDTKLHIYVKDSSGDAPSTQYSTDTTGGEEEEEENFFTEDDDSLFETGDDDIPF